MFDYNIFLPSFSRQVLSQSLEFLEEKGIYCQVDPKFAIGKKPPHESFFLVAVKAPDIKDWPFGDQAIMTGFNIKVNKFDYGKTEENQKKKVSNLFGLVNKNTSNIDIQTVQQTADKKAIKHLKSCKREVQIIENHDVYGSFWISPIFTVAFTMAGNGLIYEGEIIEENEIEESFWPDEYDTTELKEDLEDMEPEYFSGW